MLMHSGIEISRRTDRVLSHLDFCAAKIPAIVFILFFSLLSPSIYPQGSVLLVGGGTENYGDWSDKPYKWFVEHAPNRKIIVMHYADTTGWFNGYFNSLSPCTVSNRAVTSIAAANDSSLYRFIIQHDGIFLRGGDQAQYYSKWKNTLVHRAIEEVFRRGGVVGGTSAGEMVLGSAAYLSGNSDTGSLLRNPVQSITIVDDFINILSGVLAESHTNERGRIGRLPVFMASYKKNTGREITGIGVDVNSALCIGPDGIGEAMGGSAVTILRWKNETQYSIESGKSFSMKNLKYDQLLPGYKFNFAAGAVIIPSSATAFTPKRFSAPSGTVIIDGSGDQTDWFAQSGSLRRLQSLLANPNDRIGIISSPSSSADAAAINSTLNAWGLSTTLLWLNSASRNSSSFSNSIAGCGAFVIAGNNTDSLAILLGRETAAGAALQSRIDSGKPVLFLSDDGMAAGESAMGGVYTSAYNAYYGSLTQVQGLGILKGIQVVTRLYQNKNNTKSYDYTENRIMGMLWLMNKNSFSYGAMIDAGSFLVISNNTLESYGISQFSSPSIIIDVSASQWTDLPVFKRPGKPNPVQNAAFTGASIHFIRAGDQNIVSAEKENEELPKGFGLRQNYPNPFNPETNIKFSIPEPGIVKLNIYDSLGREIARLINGTFEKGEHSVRWNASAYSGGIYFARFEQTTVSAKIFSTIKLVLLK